MDGIDKKKDAAVLRRRAEALLRQQQREGVTHGKYADVLRQLNELQVHQIELELQNTELARARDEIEDGARRYAELYDFAPVAYLVLDQDFIIRQINLIGADLLGTERTQLIGERFSRFVAPGDLSSFEDFVARVVANRTQETRETCEVGLLRPDSPDAQAHMRIEAVATDSDTSFRAIVFDITEQRHLKDLIWRQANYDTLTQLPNRRLFIDRLGHQISVAQRAGQMLALLFIDLDHFKEVNDTFGHDAGDRLLVEAARRMGECVRSTDTVARLSGDEFAIFLPALTDTDRVGTVARKIGEALAQPFLIGETAVHVSASIGITLYPSDAQDASQLLINADRAMYVAKADGRNRFHYFTPSLQLAAEQRLTLIEELRLAVEHGQFELYFQPIVDLGTGSVVRAEGLLRWHHPQRGLLSPGEFIAVAEDAGLSGAIDDAVFADATRLARQWRDEPGHDIQMSINVSTRRFAVAGRAARWGGVLSDLGLACSQVGIDVTEALLLDDAPEVEDELRRVRESGITVSIDGFGTGTSALSCLTARGIDSLKIDRSIIRGVDTDARQRTLVEAIVAVAHALGIRVVATGVESVAQRDFVRAAGCDFAQGFLFAPPLPPASAWARWSTIGAPHDAERGSHPAHGRTALQA
ncbi:MAG: EAL domain-containing protein [Gammaproteobacteria bacterium]|nr:EAL domain-containing protein [Gammaproteobacteria bacterium]